MSDLGRARMEADHVHYQNTNVGDMPGRYVTAALIGLVVIALGASLLSEHDQVTTANAHLANSSLVMEAVSKAEYDAGYARAKADDAKIEAHDASTDAVVLKGHVMDFQADLKAAEIFGPMSKEKDHATATGR
jgi:hypothetical protein